jgi:hypothetical protein
MGGLYSHRWHRAGRRVWKPRLYRSLFR